MTNYVYNIAWNRLDELRQRTFIKWLSADEYKSSSGESHIIFVCESYNSIFPNRTIKTSITLTKEKYQNELAKIRNKKIDELLK